MRRVGSGRRGTRCGERAILGDSVVRRARCSFPPALLDCGADQTATPDTPMPPSAPDANPRYTAVAMALHWLLALAIFGTFGMGVYMADLPFSPLRIKLINWHKWAGLSILLLSALRLLWRLAHRPPPLPPAALAAMPPWQLRAFHATHHLMYALFFVVPLLGWAYSSAAGMPLVWFGVLPLPELWPVEDKDFAKAVLLPLHAAAAFTLVALAVLHTAAALKHHFMDRDGLLARMVPWLHWDSSR